ncbi:MAG TPA: DeoR/GlpR family DNA-binding transcription regulator [Anaerolineae bacterium]|nr:DeoR/GlpR family DNA-binding transcription regulator [Anaerolineae bacterium]
MPLQSLSQPERLERIQAALLTQPRVTVAGMARSLRVSAVTIRSDLAELERRGRLVRIHGGAVAANKGAHELNFEYRAQLQHAAKRAIGQYAASLVRDGDSLFLDASSTALELAQHLGERRELTVITNSLRSAQELATFPTITVLMPGGIVRREAFSLVGMWSADLIEQFNIGRAFMGARGFTLAEGLTDVNPDEVALKRAIVQIAKEVVALIDHTKWNQVALASFCSVEQLTTIISDKGAPREMVKAAKARGIQVVLV